MPEYRVAPALTDADLNRLFRASWPGHADSEFQRVLRHSLNYICAFEADQLVGFVNVAWDGGSHAFLLDPTVHPAFRRKGIATELVRRAILEARTKGCQWLHVDFEPSLAPFYENCGFRETQAGLICLED